MITSTDQSVTYDISSGAPATFPIPFAFQDPLVVTGITALGAETVLVNLTDYSVTGATLTRITSWAAYATVRIDRITDLTQPEDFRNGDRLDAERTEAALDRLTMQIQEARGNSDSALAAPLGDAALDAMPSAAARANRVLTFDSAGQPDVADGYIAASSYLATFLAAASLLAAQKALGLIPPAAATPVASGAQDFLAAGDAGAMPIPTNRFGATTLQALLNHLDPTIYANVSAVASDTVAVNGWTRLTVSGAAGTVTLDLGASIQPGDKVIVRNAGANTMTLSLHGLETYALPAGAVEIFVYDPTVQSGYDWVPTFRRPRREQVSFSAPHDQDLVTVEYIKRRLAALVVRDWTTRTSAADNEWRSVCWSPELNLFVAVAQTGTNNRVMTSPDGITWTARDTTGKDNNWQSVCWAPAIGFVAVGNSGTGTRVMTSPNGVTWTLRTSAADNAWLGVCWSPELGLFCAVANSGTGNRVMTSPDGITWTARDTTGNDSLWQSVCWSPELGLFCAVAQTGTSYRAMTSPDGITWTARDTSYTDGWWRTVCWSPELGLFCAIATSGTGSDRVMTSPDGIVWTTRASGVVDRNYYSVCWSPELGLFCAVCVDASDNYVMTSPDGINWNSLRASAAAQSWTSICWAPKIGRFCAVSSNGTGTRVMTNKVSLA